MATNTPLFANVRRQQNEYRAGFEGFLCGLATERVMHGWVNFKDDTPVSLIAPSPGVNPIDLNTLNSLVSRQPYHGTSPYWRAAIFKQTKWSAVNGRFTYVAGQRDFITDETAAGMNRLGQAASLITYVAGNAQRPATAAEL